MEQFAKVEDNDKVTGLPGSGTIFPIVKASLQVWKLWFKNCMPIKEWQSMKHLIFYHDLFYETTWTAVGKVLAVDFEPI